MSQPRSPERLRFHYEIERELASRLKATDDQNERLRLYGALYEELFRRVSDHPQLINKADGENRRQTVCEQLTNLGPLLRADAVFLELGAGDLALSAEVARRVARVYALDVAETIGSGVSAPNLERVLSDGVSVPLPDASVDVAYSHQLIEHLHPEDAFAQLREVYRVLKPGGLYECVTPSRLTGPHDVSRYFDAVASGFHLREYSLRELAELFERAGFRPQHVVGQAMGRRFTISLARALALEATVELLPAGARRAVVSRRPLRWLLNTLNLVSRR